MGVEYGLYETCSKEFIGLGKRCHDGSGFQGSALVLAAFLARHPGGTFEMLADTTTPPEFREKGWKCMADWQDAALRPRPRPFPCVHCGGNFFECPCPVEG